MNEQFYENSWKIKVKVLQHPCFFISLIYKSDRSFDVRDVDSVLSTMILGSQPFKTKPNQYWANIKEIVHEVKEPLLLLCAAVVVAHLVLATFRYFPLWKIVLAICLVSVIWHWVHMYKTAWATKKSNLFKLQDVPKECRPGEMSWFQTIESFAKSTVSNTDRCQEYHKARVYIFLFTPLFLYIFGKT